MSKTSLAPSGHSRSGSACSLGHNSLTSVIFVTSISEYPSILIELDNYKLLLLSLSLFFYLHEFTWGSIMSDFKIDGRTSMDTFW